MGVLRIATACGLILLTLQQHVHAFTALPLAVRPRAAAALSTHSLPSVQVQLHETCPAPNESCPMPVPSMPPPSLSTHTTPS
jgi:hypothetical protein